MIGNNSIEASSTAAVVAAQGSQLAIGVQLWC